MTKLLAFAGPSRSGKGTAARVVAEECAKLGLASFERQLSDNGKWSLARIFRPTIGRVEAVAWFEELKGRDGAKVSLTAMTSGRTPYLMCEGEVPLQKFLQHGLQDGGRDIFGEDLWTDRIIAAESTSYGASGSSRPPWIDTFFDEESGVQPTDLAIISDLRQPNEAERVRDLGGIVVEMFRPDADDGYRTGREHVTERRLPHELVHHRVVNDGTAEELEAKVRMLFYTYLNTWIMSGRGAHA